MLGYIRIDKPELRLWEYERYRAFYCGLCKELSKHGLFAPYLLSYDTVFLALFLSALSDELPKAKRKFCGYKLGKVTTYSNEAICYSALCNIVLGMESIKDNIRDGDGFKYNFAKLLIGKAYAKTPDNSIKSSVSVRLEEMYSLEKEGDLSLDVLSSSFGELLVSLVVEYPVIKNRRDFEAIRVVFFNLGKWIYTIDALDDLEDDLAKQRFNPLLKGDSKITPVKEIKAEHEFALFYPLSQMTQALELIEFGQNKSIIDNILYGGLLKISQEIFEGRKCDNERSPRNTWCPKRSHH